MAKTQETKVMHENACTVHLWMCLMFNPVPSVVKETCYFLHLAMFDVVAQGC